MLTILDAEILNDKVLNYKISKAKKDQILLCDTHRRIIDFMNMIKYRNNGNYEDLPHYVISKMGDIYQLFDTNNYSTTFNDEKIDRKIIKISIENLFHTMSKL